MVTQPNIFLEIGCGRTPVPLKGNRQFTGNSAYLGIDSHGGSLDGYHGARAICQRKYPDQNIDFLEEDGRALPLADNAVDEVYFANVFGYDNTVEDELRELHRQRRNVWAAKNYQGGSPPWPDIDEVPLFPALIREAARVLRPEGSLKVLETKSPASFVPIRRMLTLAGFAITTYVRNDDPAWLETVSPYDNNPETGQGDRITKPYYLEASLLMS
jgi:ubiquinone/menaquinone biosynthesis C-methylase UbiE